MLAGRKEEIYANYSESRRDGIRKIRKDELREMYVKTYGGTFKGGTYYNDEGQQVKVTKKELLENAKSYLAQG
jgi:hypothetical protein